MPLLIGNYNYTVDDKGRVNIPAKFRKNLAPEAENTFVVTKGEEDKCLDVYPLNVFMEKFVSKMNEFSETKSSHRYYTSKKGSDSDDQILDKQGRITISTNLLNYAGIKKDVVIVGAVNRIEIWNPVERETYLKKMEKTKIDIEEGLMP